MTKPDSLSVVGLLTVLALQVWATLRIHRSALYKPLEKRAQLKLIWMVPLLGASLSLAMLASDHDHPPRNDSTTSS
jgi:hypothetical protein